MRVAGNCTDRLHRQRSLESGIKRVDGCYRMHFDRNNYIVNLKARSKNKNFRFRILSNIIKKQWQAFRKGPSAAK